MRAERNSLHADLGVQTRRDFLRQPLAQLWCLVSEDPIPPDIE
jgi:hypothetical protein